MYQHLLMELNGITPEEYHYLEQVMSGMNEHQAKAFMMYYRPKRKSPQEILLFTLPGFVVVAGIQRFVIGQIGMGLLYLFTGGLCLVGTIVDLINHRSLAGDYNQKVANEWAQIARSIRPSGNSNNPTV